MTGAFPNGHDGDPFGEAPPRRPLGWWDRAGKPITVHEADRLLRDPAYRRIGFTMLASLVEPVGVVTVSTMWMGTDVAGTMRVLVPRSVRRILPPLIFETVVFTNLRLDLDVQGADRRCYPTETDAREGHAELVAAIVEQLGDPIVVEGHPTQPTTTTEGETNT